MDSINPINSTNVLITGGCGFIGLNLIDFLIKKGLSQLRILDNLSVGKREHLESLLSELGNYTSQEYEGKISYSLGVNSKSVSYEPSAMNSEPLSFEPSASSSCASSLEPSALSSEPVNYEPSASRLSPCELSPVTCELLIGDIRDKEACLSATQGMEAIIHLAAQTGVIPSIENPDLVL